MSEMMEEEIKQWTARRKSALVLEIIQGKTSMVAANRHFDLTPVEIESRFEDGKRVMRMPYAPNPRTWASSTSGN
ncbi:hypothetical protein [Xanthomonas albilineans]|uniref:Hypothetical isxo8 transposase protein n=1 Tax=Xanthomonas albilineans (strain GPE PC73 / CFBP 7063) TaxID=380358 RepID=D2UER8_XANAP